MHGQNGEDLWLESPDDKLDHAVFTEFFFFLQLTLNLKKTLSRLLAQVFSALVEEDAFYIIIGEVLIATCFLCINPGTNVK